MNYKILIIIIFAYFLVGCEQNKLNKIEFDKKTFDKYKNSGFALVYNKELKAKKKITKKLDNRSLLIFHKSLKKNSFVKITNPTNQKTIIAEVVSNQVQFSDFYNCVISLGIAEELSLDLYEPYVDLVLISQDSSFIAKKAKTFEEEKKIAEKAPIDGIQIDNLGSENLQKNDPTKEKFFNYSIKIADFYYKDSARACLIELLTKLILKTQLSKHYQKQNIGYY